MVKPVMIIPLLALVLVVSSRITVGEMTHVHIMNRLEEGRQLDVHCQSGDDDLGFVTVPAGNEMTWSFVTNVWGTTLFYCWVKWSGSDVWLRFDAYDWSRDRARCNYDCRWMFANNTLYGFEPDDAEWRRFSLARHE